MNGNDYHKWLTVREGQAEKGDVSRKASRSRQPIMLHMAQLLVTRGTDWNATRSNVEYLSTKLTLTTLIVKI
jgi:hypothetical protein